MLLEQINTYWLEVLYGISKVIFYVIIFS